MSFHSDLPSVWARDALSRANRAYDDDRGQLAQRYLPSFLPDVPFAAIIAFVTYGTWDEVQTGASFFEDGPYQIPAGAREGPNPAANSTFGRLARSSDVQQALGRAVDLSNWPDDHEGQTAVGLSMLQQDYESTSDRLDPRVRPRAVGTPWGVAVMFMGFSAGATDAASVINRYADALASVDDDCRFSALVQSMAREVAAGVEFGGSPRRHSNPVHRVASTWKKFELARQIAVAHDDPQTARFFDLQLGAQQAAYEQAITSGDYQIDYEGPDLSPTTCTPRRSMARTGWLLVGLLVAAVVGWWLWRRYYQRRRARR